MRAVVDRVVASNAWQGDSSDADVCTKESMEVLRYVDVNGDGKIDHREFTNGFSGQLQGEWPVELVWLYSSVNNLAPACTEREISIVDQARQIFLVADADRSGALDNREQRALADRMVCCSNCDLFDATSCVLTVIREAHITTVRRGCGAGCRPWIGTAMASLMRMSFREDSAQT